MANLERTFPERTTPPNEPLPAYSPRDELPPPSPAHQLIHEQTVLDQQQDEGPPPYTESLTGGVDIHQGGIDTAAHVAEDGRVNININEKTRRMSQILERQWITAAQEPLSIPPGMKHVPPLNILIQIIGSRGDVQPFIALGQQLKQRYSHRIRVATHPVFKDFVEEGGLEFFSLGGDPAELMAFMVKNPGLVPGLESLRAGDVTKRRKGMWEVLLGGWRACIEPPTDGGVPFVADAIIANPPSFAHIHCAEKLGVPLHLMFTMPWSPTAAFPHPLANIESTNAEASVTNFLSYALVELLTWQGLGDLVNKFREKNLGLEPISPVWAPGMISRLKVPHTYCWSPSLIPKPTDWGTHVNISGFFFLPLAHTYTPTEELAAFLAAGPPPVYIGFGSIVVDNPNEFTAKIVEAVRLAKCRALISQGWGGLGNDSLSLPDDIMLLGNCPHDWLFPQCAAVVHHGGAGTTAAGIRCGKPAVIVPFFGDQQFWGNMVARAGAGPDPIHHSLMTAENLAERIKDALTPGAKRRAEELGARIRIENGAEEGAKSFHQYLHVGTCDLLRDRVAVWKVKGSNTKLSALAARILVDNEQITNGYAGLRLWRHREWATDEGPVEPISGASGALLGTIGTMMMGIGDFPRDINKIFRAGTGKGKEIAPNGSPSSSSSNSSKLSLNSSKTSLHSGQLETSSIDPPSSPQKSPSPELTTSQKIETVLNASKGVKKIVGAGLKSPMDFTMGLAQGFRNAPRLYGDSVRPASRVTGIQSGLKAAGKEFALGMFDGVTGLVTQPFEGAKQEGAAGLVKGTGKGLAGLVLKSGAAIYGLPGYAMKGVYAEILKRGRKDVTDLVSMARVAQGMADTASPETERMILERWEDRGLMMKKRFTFPGKTEKAGMEVSQGVDYDDDPNYVDVDKEMEEAIKRSVQETSRGVHEEDEVVEQAIRESLMDSEIAEALKLSIQHQREDGERMKSEDPGVAEAVRLSMEGDGGEDADLKLAMRLSLAEQIRPNEEMSREEKGMLERVIRESLNEQHGEGSWREV